MVPKIADRGTSFTGAGMYYLHDREAQTDERVEWVHTHNLPTNNPDKAIKWMAYTSMSADKLKRQAGVKSTGRKATAGSVYTFSLAWHPEENPDQDHMIDMALSALSILELKDHETLMVAHNDADYAHVHCITNLVNPRTGKHANPYKDHLKLSQWAEDYEKEYSQKIYCDQRVKNNELRKQEENRGKIIKYKEERLQRASLIQSLYQRSDNGKAFMAGLHAEGYTLSSGHKGRLVLVDHHGDVFSLPRQLKGQRARDIKQRLSDIDFDTLKKAKDLSEERRYFDRDKYAQTQQDKIDRAGVAHDRQNPSVSRPSITPSEEQDKPFVYDDRHLKILDLERELKAVASQKLGRVKRELDAFYKPGEERLTELISQIQSQLIEKKLLDGVSGRVQELKDRLHEYRKSLQDSRTKYQEHLRTAVKKIKEDYETRLQEGTKGMDRATSNDNRLDQDLPNKQGGSTYDFDR